MMLLFCGIFNSLLLFSSSNLSDSLNNKMLTVFNTEKKYIYEANFIDQKGKKISTEFIELKPTEEPWKWDKLQISLIVNYNFSKNDSLTFAAFINPKSKSLKKPKPYFWQKSIVTGAVENDSLLWMHPFRENQYNYTEIAPFPEIIKTKLYTNGEWRNGINIMMGWGNFKGKVISNYKVVGKENRIYGNLNLIDCWLIKAVGEHDKLGKSYLDFYYHPQYGFVEMNYTFYDGVKISFVLEKVTHEN